MHFLMVCARQLIIIMEPKTSAVFQEAEKLFKCGKYEDAEKKYTEFIKFVQAGGRNNADHDIHPAFRGTDTR